MSHKARRLTALAAAAAVIGATSMLAASASAITIPFTFDNWAVWGSLTDKKLNEPVVLPKGSTFNGTSLLTSTATELSGTVTGRIFVPPFNTTVKLVGLVPTEVGVTFTQVGPAEGTLAQTSTANCAGSHFGGLCVTLSVNTRADVGITETGLLGIGVPTECETSEPVAFSLSSTMPLAQLLDEGPAFKGTVTIPSIKCGGLSGLAVGTLLTELMSGPENPYALHIGPNEPSAPTVVTGAASPLSQVSAKLNATVDPDGEAETGCDFEYGTSTSYGSSAPCAWEPGSGFAVHAWVGGLEEGATYHYRVVASNTLGTSYGPDQSFTTLSASPQYGQCVAQKDGNYKDGNCQSVAEKKGVPDHKGSYEWVPGPSRVCVPKKKGDYTSSSCTTKAAKPGKGSYEKAPGSSFTSSSEAVTLQTPGLDRTVSCSSSAGAGEVTSTNTGIERITFSGCEMSGKKCASEGPDGTPSGRAGVIVTNLLRTRLLGPVAGEVWTDFTSAEHQPYLAEFACEGPRVRVAGALGGVQAGDVNVSSATSTTTFTGEEGEQALSSEVSETEGDSWLAPQPSSLLALAGNRSASAIEIKP